MVTQRRVVQLDQGAVALVWAETPNEVVVSLPGEGWAVETVYQADPATGRAFTKVVLVRRQ